ncbi:MAG: tripartite tricarboxylate transporter substrate binding protein [Betaproteobacteria bacterium]|nr:tripartite tricarboxylate transporter substrate binding protein [Betaproteobacteria bacterium]
MLARLFLYLVLASAVAPANAQPYPAKPVKLIVAFAPGTTSDIIGRMIADKLTQAMGQPFVVENRTGAGGTIGAEAVAKSAPDGYTLLLSTAALPVSAHVFPNLKYDTARDFASVTVISHSPLLLAANLSFPPRSIEELIQYARANPGRVSFGSAGVGTSHHLTGEKFKLDTGIDLVHVPYKGSGPAHIDLMGGQIQLMFDNIVALIPLVKSGRVRALAVSSARRHALLPEVPSIQETGVRDFETVAWFGVVAPAGTPRETVNRLNADILKAMQLADVRQRLIDGGSDLIGSTPEAAERFLREEVEKWGKVVRVANVKPN